MKNIFIDANNMLYRAIGRGEKYFKNTGIRKLDIDGNDLNVITGFLYDLYERTFEYHKPETKIYVVWDRKLAPSIKNWRNEINPLYKGNRDEEREDKKKVHSLCIHVKRVCESLGINTIFPYSSECDDIINHLVNTMEGESLIVSADQDFYQCISDTVCVYNPLKRIELNKSNFEEHVPVSLDKYVLWKSIKGDPSDNIRGLHRYGDKRAKALVDDWDNAKEKLSEEQLEILDETIKLIDLNYKPLSTIEISAINKQIKPLERWDDYKLTERLDRYDIPYELREKWDVYQALKEFNF